MMLHTISFIFILLLINTYIFIIISTSTSTIDYPMPLFETSVPIDHEHVAKVVLEKWGIKI